MSYQRIEEVRERLQRTDGSRDSLLLLTVQLIETLRTDVKVEATAGEELKVTYSNGESSLLSLSNMLIECERSPSERAEIIERYTRVILPEDALLPTDEVVRENVVVIVRDTTYREYVSQDLLDHVTKHFVADLWLIFALDRSDSMTVLKDSELEKLGLTSEELLQIGVANLRRILGPITWEPFGAGWTFDCDYAMYAAAVLLMPDEMRKIAAKVEGDLVVGVPARDTLLFTGSNNRKGLEELHSQVKYVMDNGHHLISDTLLRLVDGLWRPFS